VVASTFGFIYNEEETFGFFDKIGVLDIPALTHLVLIMVPLLHILTLMVLSAVDKLTRYGHVFEVIQLMVKYESADDSVSPIK